MKFKNLILPITTVGAIGSGAGTYFLSKSEKAVIEKVETEEEKISKIKLENKKIADNLFNECKDSSIMKNTSAWNSLYWRKNVASKITLNCGSKTVTMNVSQDKENDYRKIIDTTKRWWPKKDEKFIVFEILDNKN